MQNLIKELAEPSINDTGNILPVSTVKRRAAEQLVLLHATQQHDQQLRLQLQAEIVELRAKLLPPSLEECIDIYKEVMNNDAN
jgi:hypothetical protein